MPRPRHSTKNLFLRNALLVTGAVSTLTGGIFGFAAGVEAIGNSDYYGFVQGGKHNDLDQQWDDPQDPASRGTMSSLTESFAENIPMIGHYAINEMDHTDMSDKLKYGALFLGGGLAMLYGRKKITPKTVPSARPRR